MERELHRGPAALLASHQCWRKAHILRYFVVLISAIALLDPAYAQNVQSPVSQIVSALKSRDFKRGKDLSDVILAKEPGNYAVWTLRGMTVAGEGNLPQALDSYQHALRLAPTYLPALEGAAQTEFLLGRPSARRLLNQILQQRPDDQTTHALLGTLDARSNACVEAVKHFQKAENAIAAQPEALTAYGTCLASLKRPDDAVMAFRSALALDPSKREARYNLALSLWDAHRGDEALEALQPLVEQVPISSDALALSAEILEAKDDTSQAVELLRKALLADPTNVDAYLQFATLSFDHASPKVGIEILNTGITQLPNEPRLYLVRGILLTQLGEFTKAADDFEFASRLNPKADLLNVAKGLVRSQQHNTVDALRQFREAVKAHPNQAYAHYLLAEALYGAGILPENPEYKEEIAAAEKAVKLDPRLVAGRDLLSSIYLQNDEADLAIGQCRAALAIDPNDQGALYHLIVALRKTGKKDELPELLKRFAALKANPINNQEGTKHYRLSIVQGSSGDSSQ